MTEAEVAEGIAARRRQINLIRQQIQDYQALIMRLQTERSVIEGEIRGYEAARRNNKREK